MRKREDEVFPNAAGIDVGGSSPLGGSAVAQHGLSGARVWRDD